MFYVRIKEAWDIREGCLLSYAGLRIVGIDHIGPKEDGTLHDGIGGDGEVQIEH